MPQPRVPSGAREPAGGKEGAWPFPQTQQSLTQNPSRQDTGATQTADTGHLPPEPQSHPLSQILLCQAPLGPLTQSTRPPPAPAALR